MNLLGQWNKDKTQCWQIVAKGGTKIDLSDRVQFRAERWEAVVRNFGMSYCGPWRDTLEEAQKDIPQDEN